MKKVLIGIVMVGVLMVGSACSNKGEVTTRNNEIANESEVQEVSKSFVVESRENMGGLDGISVIRHIETDNRFILYRSNTGLSITPLDY